VELATQLTAPNGPYSKRQVARALNFARSSYYLPRKQAKKDKAVAVAIEVQQFSRVGTPLGGENPGCASSYCV